MGFAQERDMLARQQQEQGVPGEELGGLAGLAALYSKSRAPGGLRAADLALCDPWQQRGQSGSAARKRP